MSAAPPPLRIGIAGYGVMGKAHSYGYRVAPMLRRLPRRFDRITAAVEGGRLNVNVRLLADERDRTTVTGWLHQLTITVLAATAGLLAVVLLAIKGGPVMTPQVSPRPKEPRPTASDGVRRTAKTANAAITSGTPVRRKAVTIRLSWIPVASAPAEAMAWAALSRNGYVAS